MAKKILKNKIRTMRIEDEVHKELSLVGQKSETYSDIVMRLIRFYKEHQQK